MKGVGRIRIDIGLGDGELTAVVRRGAAVLHGVTVAVDTDADGRPDVGAAFAALRARVDAAAGAGTAGAAVRIALLPPHVEARLLALPPLRAAEAAAVVRRDAGRHFLGIAAPRVTAAAAPRRSSGAPVLAAAASAAFVQECIDAARECGWSVTSVAAAHGAWVAAARRAAGARVVIAVHGAAAHVIQLDDGTPTVMRRLPADALDEIVDAAGASTNASPAATTNASAHATTNASAHASTNASAAAGAGAGAVAVFATDALRDALAHRLAARGWAVSAVRQSALDAAAHHVAASRLALVTDDAAAERRSAQARLAARLAVAAVALLIATAAVELWGAHRQLGAVRAERAAIRSQVTPLLALRDSLEELRARSGAVEAVAARSPRWTYALHDLSLMLPVDAHITRLQATGDTLVIEAEGAGAGAALQALRSAPSLTGARLLGVVDRELADGETAVERFRISARLAERRTP